jgi:hypothetical protein
VSLSSAELTAIGIEILIVLIVVRRSYAMTKGVPYSTARLALLPALFLFLWALSELESILLVPWALPYLIALDLGILLGTALTFTPVAQRLAEVRQDGSGGWSYRFGFSFAAFFVGIFVIRLVLAAVLFPSSLEFGAPVGTLPTESQQAVLALVDALFSLSAGLLLSRSLGIYRKVQAAKAESLLSSGA